MPIILGVVASSVKPLSITGGNEIKFVVKNKIEII